MKRFHLLLANVFFWFHVLLGIFILVGWAFPRLKILYIALLLVWMFSWIVLGYCPVTKWEFSLRRKYDKSIDTNAEAIQFYVKKILGKTITSRSVFIGGGIVFAIGLFLALFVT
jgi:hypothetical protein